MISKRRYAVSWPRGSTSSINSSQPGSEAPGRFVTQLMSMQCRPGRLRGRLEDSAAPRTTTTRSWSVAYCQQESCHSGATLWSTLTTHQLWRQTIIVYYAKRQLQEKQWG